jgi:protein-L-isoaspartate(D-aspartate) O-methyltransferase
MKESYEKSRHAMVEDQIARRGIKNQAVLNAMREIPRHEFIPDSYRYDAYGDHPVPIGGGQTISQPYIVAVMTEYLELTGKEKVLEIGTGTGYQATILAKLAKEVYSIEIVKDLHVKAVEVTNKLGVKNLHLRYGDGYRGWPEAAPFDAIILTAAPDHIPPELFKQLKEGGRMILPVGLEMQELILVTKENGKMVTKMLEYVRFVPMTGEAMGK